MLGLKPGFPDYPTMVGLVGQDTEPHSPESSPFLFTWPSGPCFKFSFPSPHLGLIYPGDSFRRIAAFSGLLRHSIFTFCYFTRFSQLWCICLCPWEEAEAPTGSE